MAMKVFEEVPASGGTTALRRRFHAVPPQLYLEEMVAAMKVFEAVPGVVGGTTACDADSTPYRRNSTFEVTGREQPCQASSGSIEEPS